MSFAEGDNVLIGGRECEVEVVYESEGVKYLAVLTHDGLREVHPAMSAIPAPVRVPESPERRAAVDLILEFKGVPRHYLFEYPYNEYESRTRIKEAQKLLDDLIKVLDK